MKVSSKPSVSRRTRSTIGVALTAAHIQTIQAIVNIFETGHVLGEYGRVTVIPGDRGHLTFGRSQASLSSGSLHTVLERYCAAAGSMFGHRLRRSLPLIAQSDPSLDGDRRLHNLLRATADDPVMRHVQDQFFMDVYFRPATLLAARMGITDPLGVAVIYDSFVHGSWDLVRDRVPGTPTSRGQRTWIREYVVARRAWLATHPRNDLHGTVYRMDALGLLIGEGAWALELPLHVRGLLVSPGAIAATPPGSYAGPLPGTRPLACHDAIPLASGLDVRLLQLALSERGCDVRADGVFGRTSAAAVAEAQRAEGLPITGAADEGFVAKLAAEVWPGAD